MEQSREIYRFRKNSREEIVISLYQCNNAEYLSIARYCTDGDGEGYFRKYSICIHHLLLDELLTGLQMAVQALGNGTRLFLSKKSADKVQ